MAKVFANGMEVSAKSMSGKSICEFPDVCFTPPQTPATPMGVPIPYPNTGMASDTSDGSQSVKIGGAEVMLKNKSYFKKSTGDEAGAAPKKGLISSTNKGKVYFVAWSMDVKVEGENVVRNLDLTTHNHGSNPPTGAVPTAQVAAAAAAALKTDDEVCKHKNKKKKKYVIYHAPMLHRSGPLKGKPNGKIYVGRTSGPQSSTAEALVAKRKKGHHRKDIGTPVVACETTVYAAIRGAEEAHQKHFESAGLSQSGPPKKTKTQINPISPKHSRKFDYLECAKRTNKTCAYCA